MISGKKFGPSDVTLYVPCYNAEGTISAVLDGIGAQTATPARVILIDDGSEKPLTVPGVEVIRQPGNEGLAAARNCALKSCNTALIAALDADVVPGPDWLAQLLTAMNSGNFAGVGGRLTERCQESIGDRWRAVHMAQHWGDTPLENPRFLFGANTIFRADILRQAGGYDAMLRTNNEDRTLTDRLKEDGYRILYAPSARCEHLRRDNVCSIPGGYWKWHHANGLKRGDFASPDGLINRISSVNFGIFRYRFDLDRTAGRNELLPVDLALPLVFCMLDLKLFRKLSESAVPSIVLPATDAVQPGGSAERFLKILAGIEDGRAPADGAEWHKRYIEEFQKCVLSSGWEASAVDAGPFIEPALAEAGRGAR